MSGGAGAASGGSLLRTLGASGFTTLQRQARPPRPLAPDAPVVSGPKRDTVRMRRCRHHKCRKAFEPAKDFHHYCSWDCRVADVGPHYERDYRGSQRSGDQRYDRGFWDGARATPPDIEIPPHIWKAALVLVHPNRWQTEPGLARFAHEVTPWLLAHRPADA